MLGGTLALAGTVVGAVVTYFLNRRVKRDDPAHELAVKDLERKRDETTDLVRRLPQHADTIQRAMADGTVVLRTPPETISPQDVARRKSDLILMPGCFWGDILVKMEDGSELAISEVRPGQSVTSYDLQTQLLSTSKVMHVRAKECESCTVLNAELKVTPSQQVVRDGQRVAVGEISLQDRLIAAESTALVAEKLETIKLDSQVYSLELDASRGYFVRAPGSDASLLVLEAATGKASTG